MLVDNYVKEEEGTGVVHQAPYFGAVSSIYFTSIIKKCLVYVCLPVGMHFLCWSPLLIKPWSQPLFKLIKLVSAMSFHPELISESGGLRIFGLQRHAVF